jgi:hypothetical protein
MLKKPRMNEKGRPKSNKFEPSENDYYISKRRWIALYIGNAISGIHDAKIDSKLKLEASIRGFMYYEPKTLFSEFELFGNLITPKSEFRKVFKEGDEINSDLFVTMSNCKESNGYKIYALFYVSWRNAEMEKFINSLHVEEKHEDQTNHLAIGYCNWFLQFFKKYAKKIPADEEEISKIKEVISNVRKP